MMMSLLLRMMNDSNRVHVKGIKNIEYILLLQVLFTCGVMCVCVCVMCECVKSTVCVCFGFGRDVDLENQYQLSIVLRATHIKDGCWLNAIFMKPTSGSTYHNYSSISSICDVIIAIYHLYTRMKFFRVNRSSLLLKRILFYLYFK